MEPFRCVRGATAIARLASSLLAGAAVLVPLASSAGIMGTRASQQYMPHGMCYLWNPGLLLLHVLSDACIALAYFSIPAVLVFFIRKRRDIPFRGALAMFALFIVACGLTHVLEIWTVWHPAYWLSGSVKLFTALVSVATALMLVPLIPKMLSFQSPLALERINAHLSDRFRHLLEIAQVGIWTLDAEGAINYVNVKMARMLGYTPAELMGRSAFEFLEWKDVADTRERYARREEGIEDEYERSFVHKDGSLLWALCSISPIFDPQGAYLGVLGMFSDLTELRRSQVALSASRDQYRLLADAMPQIVWTAGPDNKIDYYNRQWFAYTGKNAEQPDSWDWKTVIHPEDLERVVEAISNSRLDETPYTLEYRLKRADGMYRWHLGRTLPVRDSQGAIVKWLGTSTDIDEQKRAFEAQQRMTEQLQFVVEATDRLSGSLEMEESLQTLCDLLTPRFSDWTVVNLVEADGRIRNVALKHADPAKAAAAAVLRGTYYIDENLAGGVTSVIKTGRPCVLPQYGQDEMNQRVSGSVLEALTQLGVGSRLLVPLIVRGQVFGVLSAVWSTPERRYSEAEIPFFEEIAKRAAIACDERLRADRALVNEHITRRVMQGSEDCIALLSVGGSLLMINDSGRASFTAAGRTFELGREWASYWRAEDRPAVDFALSAALAGSSAKYQGRIEGDDISPQWWDVVVSPITDASGTPTQLLTISRNVTWQKRDELALVENVARYRAFANSIPQIAFTADAEGTLEFVNDRWIEYTGLSTTDILNHGASAVTYAGELSMTPAWFAAMISAGELGTEIRLRRVADGAYRWHLMRAVAIRDGEGAIAQWFGTGTDIEDQKRAEEKLERARDEAVEATAVKAQFLASMSHEIRTPISGVIGMTELLMLTSLSDEQREYAKIVRDSGQSLLRVINDILDFSKVEAGKLNLESLDFDLAAQINSVADLMRPQFEEKRIAFTSRIEPGVPAALVGDPGRLRQIIVNLVGNACKFTPEGGRVSVIVNAGGPAPEDTIAIRFRVEDTGIGVPADVQRKLFTPFLQGDGSTARRFGGTGLGLWICKQLVTLMSGTIGVESVPGGGSSFWFTIPFRRAIGTGRALAAPAREQGERRATVRPRSEQLLIVEDNEVNALLALRQFKVLGFTVDTARDGRAALEAVRSKTYDLVFMDCHMPVMDGFAATKAIRQEELGTLRHVPIVAMTADAQPEDRATCIAAGMDDYISKPTSLMSLGTMLERWLPEPAPDAPAPLPV